MSFDSERIGRFLVVKWATPVSEDVAELRRTAVVARAAVSAPLVFISVHDPALPVPTAAVREELIKALPEVVREGEVTRVLLIGDGIYAALKRTVLRTMLMLLRSRQAFLHGSAAELLGALRAEGTDAAALLELERALRRAR